MEEGDQMESQTQEDVTLSQMQQSYTSEDKKIEDGKIEDEEEPVDYEVDPLSQEKRDMAHLDRDFEIKVMKLLNVLKLPGMDEESEESLDTPDQGIGEEKLDTQ
jgi:hypothetical protein